MKNRLFIIAFLLIGISVGALALSNKYLKPTGGMSTTFTPTGYIKAELRDVEIISRGSGIVYLAEKDGETLLPIFISEDQAQTIALLKNDVTLERPLMHDLIGRVLDYGDIRLQYITVDRLEEGVYYATIVLQNGKSIRIDARPSDSIIIALTENAPIYVSKELLLNEGITTHPPIDNMGKGYSA